MKRRPEEPPPHLREATQAFYVRVCESYVLEEHHLYLLRLACEAWDRCQQAREALAEHGLTQPGRQGQDIARPEVAIERDSRLAFARLLRELSIDLEPPAEVRKPRRGGY